MKQGQNEIPRKWYNNHTFPIIPLLTKTKGDEHNTNHIRFNWLFFRVWSRDAFDFELAVVFDPSHWGVGITALLPYLRVVVAIPTNEMISTWWIKHTGRHK